MPHQKPLDKLFDMGALAGVRVRLTKNWYYHKQGEIGIILSSYERKRSDGSAERRVKLIIGNSMPYDFHLQHAKQTLEVLR